MGTSSNHNEPTTTAQTQGAIADDLPMVNRAVQALRGCTQAVTRATDETTLLQTVCRLIVAEGGYRLAWVGYVSDDADKTIAPIAGAGNTDAGESLNLAWAEMACSQEPTDKAMRSRQPIVCQNILTDPNFAPCWETARQQGYQSCLILPLLSDGEVLGTLHIYAIEPHAFNSLELALLTEVANSLSFGIFALRTAQKYQRVEQQRQAAAQALKRSEEQYQRVEQQRQAAVQALKLSKENFVKLFYVSPIAKGILNLENEQFLDVNYHFENLFGYSRNDLLEKNILNLEIWQDPSDSQSILQQIKSQGSIHNYEVVMQNRNHQTMICQISADSVEFDAIPCLLLICEDITDRKRAEQELYDLNASLERRVAKRTVELIQATEKLQILNVELQRSNQELEQFAYVASHDLQEPLRAVMGYTQLLMDEYGDRFDDTAQSYAGFVVDGAKRMQQLIQDLLAYSRVGTRGQAFTPTDCNQVVTEVLQTLHLAIGDRHAQITVDPLPTVRADANQLAQLWQNLLSNALKFCEQEQPKIHIQAHERDTDWLFQLEDNGIGIKPQYRERIFEIFKRLHTRREYPGTGIGLAVCKKIVTRHGGQIWVESASGQGSTFFFTLPKEG